MEEVETLEGLKEVLPGKLFEKAKEALKKSDLTEGQKKKAIKKIADLYVKSKFEAGEAFGMIAAQSLSEPSTQMSLPAEEKILVKEGEELKPVAIGEFVDRLIGKHGFVNVGGNEVLDLPASQNFFVYSLDQNEKLQLKRIKSVIRHKSPGKLLRLKTASGRQITATDHHSFVIRQDNKIVPISGKLLKIGDRLPVTTVMPKYCIGEITVNAGSANRLTLLKQGLGENVKWEAIEDIRYVDAESEYVYDISVDGLETFTTFSGIITHNTMRTYHMAGAMQIQVTLGLPRLVEIFDARRAPSTPAMTIYLKSSYSTKEKALEIAESITEVKLGNIATSSFVDLGNMQVEVVLDEKLMRKHRIKEGEMVEQLKVDFKNYSLHQRGNKLTIKPKEEATVKELQKLRGKFLDSHVHGVKSIENVVINQKDEGWVINTLGSNLKEILEIDGIDPTRTLTNNIHEIAKVLGIEAARAAIVNEVLLTLKEQGLEDVDVRHVLLVADVMTAGGTIKAVGRYGIAGTKGSVLARANFEETMKHLTKASVYNEVDTLESVVENVMINQVVPAGTGMFDVVFKPPMKKKE